MICMQHVQAVSRPGWISMLLICFQLVQAVSRPGWISMLLTLPYMTSSPTASFLVNYAPDSVGLSASIHQKVKLAKPKNDSKGYVSS